jgi:hypothetical protein
MKLDDESVYINDGRYSDRSRSNGLRRRRTRSRRQRAHAPVSPGKSHRRRQGADNPAVAQCQPQSPPGGPGQPASAPEYDDRGYPLNSDGRGANNENSYSITQPRQTASRPRWGFSQRFAAAAILLIALGGFLFWFTYDSRIEVTQNSGVIPASWVTSTAQHHIECSQHANHFGPGFPRTLSELPSSLHQYLGHDSIVPNLSKLGYQFAGAGPCTIPGGKTAHLLYRAKSGGNITRYTVSLFIQPDTNQLSLEKGKVYYATDAIDKTPMIIWRGQGVVYYLVGEDKNQLTDAARQMGMKLRI